MRPLILTLFLLAFLSAIGNNIFAQTITTGPVTGTISTCVGTASASPNIQQFTVTGTGLVDNITVAVPAGFEVSEDPNTGYSNLFSMARTGSTLSKTVYVRAQASATARTINDVVTLTSNSAASKTVAVTATINELPTVNAVGNQTVDPGNATSAVGFTGTGEIFSWTNDKPGIGLAASGSDNIPSFTAINNTSGAITANITVVPKRAGHIYFGILYSNVALFSMATNSVVKIIPNSGLYVRKTIASPDGQFIYAPNLSSDIPVIDTRTNTVVRNLSMPSGRYPGLCALSPDGTKFFVNDGQGLVVIDVVNNLITADLAAARGDTYPVFSPDGSRCYITYASGGRITVINTASNAIETNITSITNPSKPLVTRDGKYLYVADANKNMVYAISTATNTVVATIAVGTQPTYLTATPDGNRIYVTNAVSNNLSVIDISSNTVIATIPIGIGGQGGVATQDSKYIYLPNMGSQNIMVINTLSNTVIATIPAAGSSLSTPAISPDGTRVFVPDGASGSVCVINTSNQQLITRAFIGNNPDLGNTSFIDNNECSGLPVTFSITVNPPPPSISFTGTFTSVSTSYGTASASRSIMVSGISLSTAITVTPPTAFEVSTDNINFSNTLSVGGPGNEGPFPIYIRLKATTNADTYTGNLVLSSTGLASVNVPVAASTVNPVPLNIVGSFVKTYGDVVSSGTLYYNTPDVTFTNPGFKNGNSFNSIDITFSAGTAATATAGIYRQTITLSNFTGRNGYLPQNYIVSYTPVDLIIQSAPLTISAKKVTKPYGTTLINATGFTDFDITGLKNGETVERVNVSYGPGSAATAAAGIYTDAITLSAAAGGTFNPQNYIITYKAADIEVLPPIPPVITNTGNPQALNTTYGTASANSNFTITASNLLSGVLVSPPPGFEVSTDGVNYSNTITINGSNGTLTAAPVYIRLSALSNAGDYTGNIALSSGVTTLNVPMPNSTVNKAPLTLKANNQTKAYGVALTNFRGPDRYTLTNGSLKNGNTLATVTIFYGTGKNASDNVGTYTGSVMLTGVTGANGFLENNYTVDMQAADIIVTPANLTLSASSTTKAYGKVLYGDISTSVTSSGLQNGETIGAVLVSYYAGSAATDAAGSYAGAVTVTQPRGGTFTIGNYNITNQPADLTVTRVPLVISAVNKTREYGVSNPPLTLTYSGFVNGETEAQLSRLPTVSTTATTLSDGGIYPITVSGAAATNYTITYVNATLTVTPPVALVIPNLFTPNNDGINDTWKIPALASYPKCTVDVFNRYGAKVYHSVGYSIPWDGRFNGNDLPIGPYYYIIDTKVLSIKASGSITVIR